MLDLFVCSSSDTKLNDCRSNRTQCGDGDEAHCVTNGTDSFCSCKPGFQKTGHHTCGGTHVENTAPAMPNDNSFGYLRFGGEELGCNIFLIDMIFLCLSIFQIRTSVCSSECVPTSATTPKAPTSVAATSTSPGSMTPARLIVSTRTTSVLYVILGDFSKLS